MIARPLAWVSSLDAWAYSPWDCGSFWIDRKGDFVLSTRTTCRDDEPDLLGTFPTEAEAKAAAQRHADEVVANMLSDEALMGLIVSVYDSVVAGHAGARNVDAAALCRRILTTRKEQSNG